MIKKIITVTLNPAIDKSTSVQALIPEKKMKCAYPVFEPGGGGINVARALKKLGQNATAVYLAGGYTGKFFKQLLDEEKIASVPIEIRQHTRENLIVLDRSANLQYRFGMPGPFIEKDEWQQCLTYLENATNIKFIVASGSVPDGVPKDIFARMAVIAKNKKAKFIVDTAGEPLKLATDEGVYLIKPNIGELSLLAGKDELNTSQIENMAKEIIERGQSQIIVISMGAAGAMLVTKNIAQQITAPVVKCKSTVGAGDSMVAGIVQSLSKGKNLFQAVQYGVACGTAATMNAGTQLFKLDDVENLYLSMNNSIT